MLVARVRQMQPLLALPDVTMWRRIDALVSTLENDCRRLHATFMHQQSSVRAICERVTRVTGAAPSRPAVAS
jgi:hypothetical protein